MGLIWFGTFIDSRDPVRLSEFWSAAMSFEVVHRGATMIAIAPDAAAHPGIAFVKTEGVKVAKNRIHLDLQPDDQSAEVERLIARAASRVDIGQHDASWIVLADPEGNEFCVLAR